MSTYINPKIVVVIPAYNEELTITSVIEAFHVQLPEAIICVVDNNSKDKTSANTLECFAKLSLQADKGILFKETRQGKGYAVKKAFYHLDADIFLMVDADLTYPAHLVHKLIAPVLDGTADMVIGDRHSHGNYVQQNNRKFHNFGNNLVKKLINILFNAHLHDILSGYRCFSKDFVKNYPILSKGFEIETEMTLHALGKDYRVLEIPIEYVERPPGSFSKLNTLSDGFKVIKTVGWIFKDYRPLAFFWFLSLVLFVFGIAIGTPVIIEFIRYKYVYRVPSAILSTGFIIIGFLSFTIGVILDTVVKIDKRNFEEKKIKFR
ncbi:MAG TPA: glycosyltransferase family 2 protein, partial [Ferruginibacter sp.]|nr:glycosyltransferase family 2 protein [Ferruginibacter sp.]